MQVDTIRALFTYITALIVVIGGGAILYLTYADDAASNLLVMVGGFIGFALQFLFGQETATRSARQSAAATLAGSQSIMSNGDGH